MAITPVPSMTDIPEFPSLADRAAGTYNGKAYAFGSHMADTFNAELLAVADSVFDNATDAAASATTATNKAAEASAQVTSAISATGVLPFNAATSYTQYQCAISTVNYKTYRRKTAGTSATDPSLDPTNWESPVAAGIGAVTTTSGSANIALTSSSNGYQSISMTAMGKHVSLPDATTMTVGGPRFILKNDGGYPFGIRDNAGTLIMAVAAGGIAYVTLKDNSTAAGSWSVIGDNLEPGLITIDSTFSSTYTSTVLAPFVALDSNTSIHFAALSSGFAAFVVDNAGKTVGTPVTVSSTADHIPLEVFKVSATSAIVFYGIASNEAGAVILTVSGTSITVGTAQTSGTFPITGAFTGAPKVVQLSTTLYLATYTSGTNTGVVAFSVSGTTITNGAYAYIITANSVDNSTTTYALTATTALVLYVSSGTPNNLNAVVVSVSGTTCTVGTPATFGTGHSTNPPFSCLLSATKALVVVDANTNNYYAGAVTVSGTTVTWGAALALDGAGQVASYTQSSATRYNPHLFPLSSSTALLWYLDSSGSSRAVVLSESGGTVTAGTILRGSFSQNSSGSTNFGAIGAQGTADFISIAQTGAANSWRDTLIPHKISGTTITYGSSQPLPELSPTSLATALPTARLSQGDYIVMGASASALPVFRSNGDSVAKRGAIAIPYLTTPTSYPLQAVSSNRIVLIGATFGTTVNPYAALLRLLNVEIAA